MHYAKQTYYSRIRRDSVCNTFQDPIITSVIDAKKITAWGESGFPASFLAGQLGVEPPAIVFPRREWTGWSHPNTVMHAVERLAKRAGCPSVTLRSLRHFHASVLLDVRPNYAVAAERLGHSSPKITMDIYAHALEGWQQEAADAFANAMQPAA